jgi:hypothetical protein
MHVHLWSYLAQFFLEWVIFWTMVVQKVKTHIWYSVIFFFENRAVYEIMWKKKNIVEPVRPQMTKWRMHIACLMPKVTDTYTHSEYVILIVLLTATKIARKRPSVTLYVHCLSCFQAKNNLNRIRRPISQALNLVSFYSCWLRRRQTRVLQVLLLVSFSSSCILVRTTLFSP